MTVRLELRCDAGTGSPACRTAAGLSPKRDARGAASIGVTMTALARDAGEAGWIRAARRGWICPECAEVRK